jgi:cation diffusion facilitator family transporter
MHTQSIDPWQHDHRFGQDARSPGELRTLIVVVLTSLMMVVEIVSGLAFGSMALLADGLHMASHTAALGIAVGAYWYARRRAADPRFSFGTGKVNSLAGFAGAILLVGFAVLMVTESLGRLAQPVPIAFGEAIAVAVVGLLVNGVSGVLLNARHDHHDHNLRSAYLHVLADALTSFLAIFALLSAMIFGLTWMDPLMGIVGAVLVTRWSWGLLRQTSRVLLDYQAPAPLREAIRNAIESHGDERVDRTRHLRRRRRPREQRTEVGRILQELGAEESRRRPRLRRGSPLLEPAGEPAGGMRRRGLDLSQRLLV